MLLKDNKLFKLSLLTGGSFSGMDRLLIPHNNLLLIKVEQREDNGNIRITTKAKDGREELSGEIRFSVDDREKKDNLFRWLQLQIGKDVESIYSSNFNF